MTTAEKTRKSSSTYLRKALLVAAVTGAAAWGAVTFSPSSRAAEETFTAAQKDALGAYIKEYLVSHPEDVVAALEAYQRKQQADETAAFSQKFAAKKEGLMNGSAPTAGNAKGDVTVVEFFDYNCGYCKKAVEDIIKLLETDKDIKVIFIDMPILSQASMDAARWALAADKQGKYYDYHVALMKDPTPKNAGEFEKLGKKLGLDVEKMRKDAESKEVRAAIEQNLALGRDLGIRGTPGFIIGDLMTPGYIGYDAMKAAIENVRAAKKQ